MKLAILVIKKDTKFFNLNQIETMFKAFIDKLINKKKPEIVKEGTVKFFNVSKGFGFIKVKDTDEDIFVHSTNLIDKIREGDKVQFGVEEGEKGPSAVRVKVV